MPENVSIIRLAEMRGHRDKYWGLRTSSAPGGVPVGGQTYEDIYLGRTTDRPVAMDPVRVNLRRTHMQQSWGCSQVVRLGVCVGHTLIHTPGCRAYTNRAKPMR